MWSFQHTVCFSWTELCVCSTSHAILLPVDALCGISMSVHQWTTDWRCPFMEYPPVVIKISSPTALVSYYPVLLSFLSVFSLYLLFYLVLLSCPCIFSSYLFLLSSHTICPFIFFYFSSFIVSKSTKTALRFSILFLFIRICFGNMKSGFKFRVTILEIPGIFKTTNNRRSFFQWNYGVSRQRECCYC